MWYLIEDKPDRTPAPRYWLGGVGVAKGVSIGRKHVDIRLKASSVSRTHAKLVVEKAPFHAHPHPHRRSTIVSVSDYSAYGTFLKYPKGHPSARNLNSHHIRLDKDTPKQIFDGALLSFGAPAAWWRLVWHHVLVFPYNLTYSERLRLDAISTATGLDITNTLVENSTHLITNRCNPQSTKFLTALLSGACIVTPAWAESLHGTVTNTFRAISDAPNSDAAEIATTLKGETRFLPEFDDKERESFGEDVLIHAFDAETAQKRKTLFQGYAFTFAHDKLRLKWVNIIRLCGGRLIRGTEQADNAKSDELVIHVGGSPVSDSDIATNVSEMDISKAIMSADSHGFDGVSLVKSSGPTSAVPRVLEIQDSPADGSDDQAEEHPTKKRRLNNSVKKTKKTGAVDKVSGHVAIIDSDRDNVSPMPNRDQGSVLSRKTPPPPPRRSGRNESTHQTNIDTLLNPLEPKLSQRQIELETKPNGRLSAKARSMADNLIAECALRNKKSTTDKSHGIQSSGWQDQAQRRRETEENVNSPVDEGEDYDRIAQERTEVRTIPLVGGDEQLDNYRAFRPSQVVVGSRFALREIRCADRDIGKSSAECPVDED